MGSEGIGGALAGAAALVYVGFLFKAAGFLVRDELLLRVLVGAGTAISTAYYFLQDPVVIPPIVTNGLLIAINLVLIGIILMERTTLSMDTSERDLFRHLDKLSPGQFRRLMRRADWRALKAGDVIVTEGEVLDRLHFVTAPAFAVSKGGRDGLVDGPGFVGEVAFLRGSPASATVRLTEDARVVSWSFADLRAEMKRSKAMDNAIVARLSAELAHKVARSMPVEGAEGVSPLAG